MEQSTLDGCTPNNPAIYISGGIGDGILNMVFARALAEHAGTPVTLLMTQPEASLALFRAQSYVKEVVPLKEISKLEGRARVTEASRVLAAGAYDALFLFTFRSHIAAAARLAGIPQRVGYLRWHHPHFARWLTDRVWVRRKGTPHPDTHTWLPEVLRKVGCPYEARYPSLDIAPRALDIAGQLTEGLPRMVGFGLNASAPTRRYAAQAYAQVARILHERDPDLAFLLCGASDVQHIAQELRAALPPSIRILDITQGNTDICVSQALIARTLAFATNDSMGMHIAVAHGVPTIGLFGCSPVMRYAPCLHPLEPSDGPGMDGISPAVVAEAIWRQLPGTPRAST